MENIRKTFGSNYIIDNIDGGLLLTVWTRTNDGYLNMLSVMTSLGAMEMTFEKLRELFMNASNVSATSMRELSNTCAKLSDDHKNFVYGKVKKSSSVAVFHNTFKAIVKYSHLLHDKMYMSREQLADLQVALDDILDKEKIGFIASRGRAVGKFPIKFGFSEESEQPVVIEKTPVESKPENGFRTTKMIASVSDLPIYTYKEMSFTFRQVQAAVIFWRKSITKGMHEQLDLAVKDSLEIEKEDQWNQFYDKKNYDDIMSHMYRWYKNMDDDLKKRCNKTLRLSFDANEVSLIARSKSSGKTLVPTQTSVRHIARMLLAKIRQTGLINWDELPTGPNTPVGRSSTPEECEKQLEEASEDLFSTYNTNDSLNKITSLRILLMALSADLFINNIVAEMSLPSYVDLFHKHIYDKVEQDMNEAYERALSKLSLNSSATKID